MCWRGKKREIYGLLARLGINRNGALWQHKDKIDDNLKNRTRLTGWLNKTPINKGIPLFIGVLQFLSILSKSQMAGPVKIYDCMI